MRELLTEGGLVKTPLVAVSGWFTRKCIMLSDWMTWDHFKMYAERFILIATAVTVGIHLLNALIKQYWCKARLSGKKGDCKLCKLYGRSLCPKGIKDED